MELNVSDIATSGLTALLTILRGETFLKLSDLKPKYPEIGPFNSDITNRLDIND